MDDPGRRLSRREALALGVGAAAALAARGVRGQATVPAVVPQGPGLVVRNERPLDAEAPLSALEAFETPVDRFFVRSHFGVPQRVPAAWTLAIDGEVATPLQLTLAEVRALPSQSRAVTLECAGNGRGLYELPNTSGVQWERGAVSTATWTGVPLGLLLERAGLRDTAAHCWMEGIDRAPRPEVPTFLRSIPRARALDDVLVAWEMNGAPIPLLHGGPLRLIVPGWFGMASAKWLTHIHARTAESDNFYMAKGYRFPDQRPVEAMVVKSVVAYPLDGSRVDAGTLTARGQAWSGAGSGGIRGVDVSTDGGRTWSPGRLTGPDQPGAWRGWECDVATGAPGPKRVMARATDRLGAVQPLRAEPNAGGYANNSVHEVRFDAVRA